MVGKVLLLALLAAAAAPAALLLDVSSQLSLTDPTQLGRLSRNGIPQDWTGGEPFPGVLSPTTAYRYHTYVVNAGITPFIQISFDSVPVNTFVSAYDTAYLPNSAGAPNLGFNTNWLGDAGTSGNFFGTDPLFFQVLIPLNHDLVIVVNNTGAANLGVGAGQGFRLIVEGFIDSEFTDPAPVPEPATFLLGAGGLALLGLGRRMRRSKV